MQLKDLINYELGSHELVYSERDTILYALAVGAGSRQLELVYERDLLALPGYACALGLWAVEAAGELGAYDRKLSLHTSQKLTMHRPMPATGPIQSEGRVTGVWDKGKASIVDIEVSSEFFTASYGIFLPGLGGWGGERGPAASTTEDIPDYTWNGSYTSMPDHPAWYRLTGDLHPIHIDVDVARANGFERPILHGLCTLGIAARAVADAVDAHPTRLVELEARLAAPVMPGDTIDIAAGKTASGRLGFEASVNGAAVVKAGSALFQSPE